jgi:predicted RNA-binding protein associated with RNAse of E/G family
VSAASVHIHYRRPPDRTRQFTQLLVTRTSDCIITLLPNVPLAAPKVIDDTVALEPEAPVVWFTFPGAWHDIGRFHTCAGSFTGYYANVLTPVEGTDSLTWQTTDLFLDVWLAPGRAPVVLDAEELDEARAHGWIDDAMRERAHGEAAALLEGAAAGAWPPHIVLDWPLERALRHVAG